MASKHFEQVEDLHFRVLKMLQDQPDLSQRELAAKLGVSNGKLHYCLKALIEKGLVKLGNFANSKHHLGYVYLLTPAGIKQKARMTGDFLKRKMAEYEALRAEIAALQAELKKKEESERAKKTVHGRRATTHGPERQETGDHRTGIRRAAPGG